MSSVRTPYRGLIWGADDMPKHTSQCIGKLSHANWEVALRNAENATKGHAKKDGKVFRPYKCNICGGIHLTTKPLRKRYND